MRNEERIMGCCILYGDYNVLLLLSAVLYVWIHCMAFKERPRGGEQVHNGCANAYEVKMLVGGYREIVEGLDKFFCGHSEASGDSPA